MGECAELYQQRFVNHVGGQMSSSARRSEAPLFRTGGKTCRASLDWADGDICPYVAGNDYYFVVILPRSTVIDAGGSVYCASGPPSTVDVAVGPSGSA
jgi:hypothetical protein